MRGGKSSLGRLLVTGASGFLGGHVAYLAARHWSVYGTWQEHPFCLRGVEAIQLRLGDERAVRRLLDTVRPQVVIHCAALTDLDYCEAHPDAAQLINVEATKTIAEWCGVNAARLIFLSSDMVFDGSLGWYRETDSPHAVNVYGATKVEAEQAVQAFCANHVIARSALIYGRPRTGGSSFSTWIEQRLAAGEPVPLFVDQYRTPILVSDLAAALVELAGRGFVGVLHLAGPERTDRFAFGWQLAHLLSHNTSLLLKRTMAEVPLGAPRPRDVSLCTERAQRLLATRLHGVQDGLRRMIAHAGYRAAVTSSTAGQQSQE
ncbi:MAG: SDR family oxidoreductase [bacterium]|jgi:dTDP-4-dehydrorhamnose reductase|nr:SDR family oxidoreductase [candidate division KSB1 bacterium]MDH7559617.1 SDR family oxidoreductase [bacterium]